MPRATWNGAVIAASDDTIVVEGNHYFPAEAVDRRYLVPNERHTVCHWKGTASYFDVVVEGTVNPAAAWCYPDPRPDARHIAGRIAFWKGVKVEA
jgi:uncharacterized protein (DUF427 family)